MPWGFQEFEAPRFQDNRHMKVVRFVSPKHRPPLSPRKYRYSLLLEAESTPGQKCDQKDYVNENSNDTIGNRTRVFPACRTVVQPTAPPRTPGNEPAGSIKCEEFLTRSGTVSFSRGTPLQEVIQTNRRQFLSCCFFDSHCAHA
jgi:hypothetical protein